MKARGAHKRRGFMLARIIPRQYVESFMSGRVRFAKLGGYVKHTSKVIGDKAETLATYYSGANPTVKFFLGVDGKEIPFTAQSLSINSPMRDHGALCMVGFEAETDEELREEARAVCTSTDMREFGDIMVFFKDSVRFMRLLKAAAKKAGHRLHYGPVEYVALDHCGDMGPFRKLHTFEYQREFRFVTEAPLTDAELFLDLGSLEGIAIPIDITKPFPKE